MHGSAQHSVHNVQVGAVLLKQRHDRRVAVEGSVEESRPAIFTLDVNLGLVEVLVEDHVDDAYFTLSGRNHHGILAGVIDGPDVDSFLPERLHEPIENLRLVMLRATMQHCLAVLAEVAVGIELTRATLLNEYFLDCFQLAAFYLVRQVVPLIQVLLPEVHLVFLDLKDVAFGILPILLHVALVEPRALPLLRLHLQHGCTLLAGQALHVDIEYLHALAADHDGVRVDLTLGGSRVVICAVLAVVVGLQL